MFRFYLLSESIMHEPSLLWGHFHSCLVLQFVCQGQHALVPQRIRLNYLCGHGSLLVLLHIEPLGIMCSVGVCYQNIGGGIMILTLFGHTTFGVCLVTWATDSIQPGRSCHV